MEKIYDELSKIDRKHSRLRSLILSSTIEDSDDYRMMLSTLYDDFRFARRNIYVMLERYKELNKKKIYRTLKLKNRELNNSISDFKGFSRVRVESSFRLVTRVYHEIYADVRRNRLSMRIKDNT